MKLNLAEIKTDKQTVNSLFMFLQKMVVAVVGYLFWIVAARLFPSDQIGLATTIAASLWLVVVISTFGLGETLVRFLPSSAQPNELASTSIILIGATTVVVSAVFVLVNGLGNDSMAFLAHDSQFGLLFVALAVLWSILTLFEYLFLALEKTQFAFVQTLIWASGKIIFLLVGFRIFVTGYNAVFWSWFLAGLIALLLSLRYYLPKYLTFRLAIRPELLVPHLKFASLNCLTLLLTFGLQMILPLVVIARVGRSASAYFYFDWTIAFLLCTVANAISSAMLARVSNNGFEFKVAVKKALLFSSLLILPAALVLFLFADKILLIFGEEYAVHGSALLKYLAVGTVLYIFLSLFKYIQLILKRADRALAAEAFVTVTTLVTSALLMQKGGIVIIGKVWLLALVVPTIISFYLIAKIIFVNINHSVG